jgi:long-subunit fatty acid transport protein
LATRPIESAIAGPTDPQVAAAFYNPAALGPLHGLHFWMDGAARLHEGTIERTHTAGLPADAQGTARINYTDLDAFLGISYEYEPITVALTTQVPYAELASFGDSPVRYHSIDQTFVHYQQSVAVAFRLASRFHIGAAVNFDESWMRWRFDRDAAIYGGSAYVNQSNGLCGGACGFENAAARERLSLRGFGMGLSVSVGLLGRVTDRVWLGASYISHTFGYHGGDEVTLSDELGATVSGPSACGGSLTPCNANFSMNVYVPDIVMVAGRFELTPSTELEATLRWIHYGERAQLDLHVQGGKPAELPQPQTIPPLMVRDLGLQDTFGAEVSLRYRVSDKLRLSPSLFFETSAVEKSAVSAAALDAPKIDAALTIEWKPVKHLTLGASAGLTSYILGNVNSRQNPQDTVDCVDSGYSLDKCHAVATGAGLPDASGRYTLFVVHLGGAIGVDY